jgi:hypothetical protein
MVPFKVLLQRRSETFAQARLYLRKQRQPSGTFFFFWYGPPKVHVATGPSEWLGL